ncbi:MAG: hypothetical protein HZB41_10905 [Ignavibacteriae bacterium]|nr:hypothetical protein [Ignavibacteriota bacterium]
MNKTKTFDCVQFQRSIREKMLKEADYDLDKLIKGIEERLKTNDLYKFLIERQEKQSAIV